MIICRQIHSGKNYLNYHLSAIDYYSQKERTAGYWYGKAAERLGIHGLPVNPEHFEAIRTGRHPLTGERLRPRSSKVSFHDMVLSAPKGFSIMALVAGDERLFEAFDRAVRKAFDELEKWAEVRDRQGKNYHTEKTIRTGNAVAAVFTHETSRSFEPQLHAHCVMGNLSWCEERKQWLALQPAAMMRESKAWIRGHFHRILANECLHLGHEIEWLPNDDTFRFTSIAPEIEKIFSSRSSQRESFRKRHRKLFGENPSKQRVAQFISDKKWQAVKRFKEEYYVHFGKQPDKRIIEENVRDWRPDKTPNGAREKVGSFLREKLTTDQIKKLDEALARALEFDGRKKTGHSQEDQKMRAKQAVKSDVPAEKKKTLGRFVEAFFPKRKKADSGKCKPAAKTIVRTERKTAINATSRVRLGLNLYHALRGRPNAMLAKQLARASRRRMRR